MKHKSKYNFSGRRTKMTEPSDYSLPEQESDHLAER
jgi:hypothetical protein